MCQISILPSRNRIRRKTVDAPATRSPRIMIFLRLQRSTKVPATGLKTSIGTSEKRPTRARAVARPVISHAQIVRPNRVIDEPMIETNCPSQTSEKPNIPSNRSLHRVLFPFTACHPSHLTSSRTASAESPRRRHPVRHRRSNRTSKSLPVARATALKPSAAADVGRRPVG